MKKTDVEDVIKNNRFAMQEYTEFLRSYLKGRRDVNKKVYKIVGRIYKVVKNGATEKQINLYIATLKKLIKK